MTHYQTTTDKVLAIVPPPPPEETMIGEIHLPPNSKLAQATRTAICELVAHSVGPDCKTVKAGDRFLYNVNHVSPLPIKDCAIIVMPEGQILAVVKERIELTPTLHPYRDKEGKILTIDEIRVGLGMTNPDKMPEEPPQSGASISQG